MRTSQRPTIEKDRSESDSTIHNHPAYGVVRISNPQGHQVLFGSDAEHWDYIELEIAPARMKRGLHTDWIHGDSMPIVSVAMSHAQFVSMIQSSGKGCGTPCTILSAPKDMNQSTCLTPSIEPIQSKTELIKDEIKRDTQKALDMANLAIRKLQEQVTELKAKKSITKKDIHTLEPLIGVAQTKLGNLPSNLKFALTCAEETIDKAVHDAQIEIEASAEHKLRQIGLEAVADRQDIDLSLLLPAKNITQSDN